MTQSVFEFISSVRAADSLEQERYLINNEQADIRSIIRDCDPHIRPRLIVKLIFLHTLGYNVAYGQIEVMTLMGLDPFSFKRYAYMAASLIIEEESEISVLITHTVSTDLHSPNPQIQCLALTLISNIGNLEICRGVSSEVIRLVDSGVTQVIKRAAMAGVRIVEKCPDLAEGFKTMIQKLLKHGSHGVVTAAIHLMSRTCQADSELHQSWQRYFFAFVKILKQLNTSKAANEFMYQLFNDPFLQVRILKILSELGKNSDELDDLLESIATGVDIRRNTGRAILFQCVETICAVAHKQDLKALAFSQVGRLFRFKESNVLYSALSVFSRVLYSGGKLLGEVAEIRLPYNDINLRLFNA